MAQASISFRPRGPDPVMTPGLPQASTDVSTELRIEGMDCAACAQQVTQALTSVPNVVAATVDLAAGHATVRWGRGATITPEALTAAVGQAGYRAQLQKLAEPATLEFLIGGMTCQNCAQHVQSALQGVKGVASATVDLASARATVRLVEPSTVATAELVAAVSKAGYEASMVESAGAATTKRLGPESGWRAAVFLGVPVTLAMAIAEWAFGLGMNRGYHWIAFFLALPIQVWVGGKFYRGAWRQLLVGRSNMDTLVSLGSTAAFGFSLWALVTRSPGHLYFMESVGILTLISVGHWLEARMSAQAGAALKALLNLAPSRARKLEGQAEREVAVAELTPGDQIVLKPGDRVPVDAEVRDGASSVDEAMLTGEPLPVEKAAGAKLFAGTVNQTGRLVAAVSATGQTTALAQIIAAVERAQSSRADIQRLADRVSSIFVPIVVVIAVLTALWWGLGYESAKAFHQTLAGWLWAGHVPSSPVAAAFVMLAAVLIVACPCAMGLATPTALMAGVNAAARRGILIRDAQALEKSGRVTTVIFDKTGTLTVGRPIVAATWDPSPAQDSHGVAARLAAGSQHPLAQAVAGHANAAGNGSDSALFTNWQEVRGSGVEARLGSGENAIWIRLGSAAWMDSQGIAITPATEFAQRWAAEGATILYYARDHQLQAAFALRDALKPGARELVSQLRATGLQVRLLTGDQRTTALAIGAELGLPEDHISAQVRPEQKAAAIQAIQQRGERVAFVGDGLNDGPALAQADLGIAVTRATDVAKEAADILLLKSDLSAIPEALRLAQATLRVIRQNLFWAFFYNAAFIPLAAFGFLSPMLSAVAMALSDVIVIGNALRLRRMD